MKFSRVAWLVTLAFLLYLPVMVGVEVSGGFPEGFVSAVLVTAIAAVGVFGVGLCLYQGRQMALAEAAVGFGWSLVTVYRALESDWGGCGSAVVIAVTAYVAAFLFWRETNSSR